MTVQQLALQRREEALAHRVVVSVPHRARQLPSRSCQRTHLPYQNCSPNSPTTPPLNNGLPTTVGRTVPSIPIAAPATSRSRRTTPHSPTVAAPATSDSPSRRARSWHARSSAIRPGPPYPGGIRHRPRADGRSRRSRRDLHWRPGEEQALQQEAERGPRAAARGPVGKTSVVGVKDRATNLVYAEITPHTTA